MPPIDPTPRNAAHLLRRAAWGGTPDEIAAVVNAGIEASVDALLDPTGAPGVAEPGRRPGPIPYDAEAVTLWFLHLAATSPTPAVERLTWFWHGHFATSLEKVEFPDLMFRQLATLRRHGLGRFDDLVTSMIHDPAMNLWLDLHTSVVGAPNENFARELMELFTLGAGNAYTQRDVVEVARAFTGYGLTEDRRVFRPNGTRLIATMHDYGDKTVLGRTGSFDGADVVGVIVERPECHRFVAERLWLRHAGVAASAAVIDDLAAAFARELQVHDLLRAMYTHPAFYAPEVHHGLVTQPVEAVVRTIRGFGLDLPDPAGRTLEDLEELDGAHWPALEWLEQMGQNVGHPPNVGGWPHNEPWLDTNRAAGRLLAGTSLGTLVAESDLPIGDELRSAIGRPAALTAALMAAFGVVAWSDETEAAVAAAMSTGDAHADLVAAIAIAFTSPEVTLS